MIDTQSARATEAIEASREVIDISVDGGALLARIANRFYFFEGDAE